MPFETPMPLEDLINPLAGYRAGRAMAHRGGELLLAAVKERTPVYRGSDPERKRRPGSARESVQRTPVMGLRGAESGWVVRVFTLDPVFPYIEWDTKPHVIVPRPPKQALRFYVQGSPVFARVVHHPGTKGVHPFARGTLFVEATLHAALQPQLEQFARELVA